MRLFKDLAKGQFAQPCAARLKLGSRMESQSKAALFVARILSTFLYKIHYHEM
jgi:hypothetical protein